MHSFQIKPVLFFLALVAFQVLLLNNFHIGGSINPQAYVLFILILPFSISRWKLLMLAFFTGLLIDVFCDSLAIHASASVFMAFCRPFILKVSSGFSFDESPGRPSFALMGTFSLVTYSFLLVFAHHLWLFFLEVFHLGSFTDTLYRVVINSLITLLFVLIGFALTDRPMRRSR